MGVRRAANGFTLIELLVVVVLIGIMMSLATLSLSRSGLSSEIQEQANRLAALIGAASEEAVLSAVTMGLLVEPHSYQFLRHDGQQWQPISDDPLFRPRTLIQDLELRLYLDDLSVSLEERDEEVDGDGDSNEEEEPLMPQVFFLSSGERTPFAIEIALASGELRRLDVPIFGELEQKHRQAEEI